METFKRHPEGHQKLHIFTTVFRVQYGAMVGYYFRAKQLYDMDLSFLPVVLYHPKVLQLQDLSVMALGRVTYSQKTPCTQQVRSWVPFSGMHKAEGRVILAVPAGLGTA